MCCAHQTKEEKCAVVFPTAVWIRKDMCVFFFREERVCMPSLACGGMDGGMALLMNSSFFFFIIAVVCLIDGC